MKSCASRPRCIIPFADRGQWVRVKQAGLYKDDLAKVVDVDNASQRAIVWMLPRLDLDSMATRVRRGHMITPIVFIPRSPQCRVIELNQYFLGNLRTSYISTPSTFIPRIHPLPQEEAERKKHPFGRRGAVRPQAKPFNAEEARQLALSVTRAPGADGQTYLMLGTKRFVNGYIEKSVAFKV